MYKVGLTRHSIGRRQIGQIRRWWVHTTPDELYDIPWIHIKYGIVRTERDNPFFGSTPYDRLHCCNGRRHRRGFHQMFGTHICGLVWIERQRITRQGFESNRKFIGAKRELLSIRELGAAAVRRNADGSKGKRHPLDTVKDDSKVNLFFFDRKCINCVFLCTNRLGERINDESSIYYWAAKNKIPVFSPALTDGSLGDMLYFHSYRNPGLIVDIISDLRRLNTMAVKACNSGIIIVGGGLIKHHICNANLMVSALNKLLFIFQLELIVVFPCVIAKWSRFFGFSEYCIGVWWQRQRSATRRSGVVGKNSKRSDASKNLRRSKFNITVTGGTDIC